MCRRTELRVMSCFVLLCQHGSRVLCQASNFIGQKYKWGKTTVSEEKIIKPIVRCWHYFGLGSVVNLVWTILENENLQANTLMLKRLFQVDPIPVTGNSTLGLKPLEQLIACIDQVGVVTNWNNISVCPAFLLYRSWIIVGNAESIMTLTSLQIL